MIGLSVRIRRKVHERPGSAPLVALTDVAFRIEPGEFLCVLGPSGCGKSTLLNLIAGLDHAYEGTIEFDGGAHPRVGFVFQTPRLLPWRTARENIEIAMPRGDVAADHAGRWLRLMGLEGFAEIHPERLSLGMQRRVSLARAFAARPDLLLMDEPFVSIDAETARRLRRLLAQTWRENPVTVIFVTHDIAEAAELADSVLILTPGPGTVRARVPSPTPAKERAPTGRNEGFRDRLNALTANDDEEPSGSAPA